MSNKNKTFKPHLATDADLSKLKYPLFVLVKVDGVRLLVDAEGKAVGRSLKAFANKKLTEKFSHPDLVGIEGEVYQGEMNDALLCSNTTSIVNTIKGELPTGIMLFDYSHPDVIELDYFNRMVVLGERIDKIREALHPVKVSIASLNLVTTEKELLEFYNEFLDQGYEGIIIRKTTGKYKFGRTTVKEGDFLRIKPVADREGLVVELVEAMENLNEAKTNELGHTERSTHQENLVPKGMVGAMIVHYEENGETHVETIGAGKMKHDERIHYWNNPDELIGQYVKFRSLATGEKDKLRQARFISIRAKEDMSE
jgi:DNA ligase-1